MHVPSRRSHSSLARGDRVDAVAQLAPGLSLLERGHGRPCDRRRPGAGGCPVGRRGGRRRSREAPRVWPSVRLIDRGASTDFASASSRRSRRTPRRWRARSCSARTISRRRTSKRSGAAGSRICWRSPACTSCWWWRRSWRRCEAYARSGSWLLPRGSRHSASRRRVGVPLAWIYADLAGGSVLGAIRAAWMTSVALFAHVLVAQARTPARAFGALDRGHGSVSTRWSPFDLSFALLSAAATAGLLALSPRIARLGSLARSPPWLAPSRCEPFRLRSPRRSLAPPCLPA